MPSLSSTTYAHDRYFSFDTAFANPVCALSLSFALRYVLRRGFDTSQEDPSTSQIFDFFEIAACPLDKPIVENQASVMEVLTSPKLPNLGATLYALFNVKKAAKIVGAQGAADALVTKQSPHHTHAHHCRSSHILRTCNKHGRFLNYPDCCELRKTPDRCSLC